MFLRLRLTFVLCFAQCAAFAQQTDSIVVKRVYTTKPVLSTNAPVIDGVLTDSSWDLVPWSGDYIENTPDENTPPTYQTKFKILYDQKFLYIGFRCYDEEPSKIVDRLSRRDEFEGDWVEINIDSYNDKRTAFSFTISAASVKGDEFVSNNGNSWDASWNPIWYAKAQIDEQGWTAEMKIPLSQLKFASAEDAVWGFQSTRRFFRAEERSMWQRMPADAPGWVSSFGELRGLKNLKPQRQLEIQPYVVGKLRTYEAEPMNPFQDGSDLSLAGGLDAKIGITNDLTLDLTINPDFGQVEADPSAIALDGFQIFFEEKRPFFIENNNIFNYQVSGSEAGNTFGSDNLFYSRRIGRSPQGYPNTPNGAFIDLPENTNILGAAKFSGKTKGGWSIGILESITGKEHANIDEPGGRRREMVEPLTNYFVARVQKDFNEQQTYVGGIFTATNRESLPDHLDFLHRAGYTAGVDFKHQWNDRDWYVGGRMVYSHVAGSTLAISHTQRSIRHLFQRIDADHVTVDPNKTSLSGTGGNIQLGKVGNGHWKFETGATWRSPELELNDLGFMRQADDIRHYAWVGYQSLKPNTLFRRYQINYNHWSVMDFQGNFNSQMFNTNSNQTWLNNWQSGMSLDYAPIQFSTTALRGGPRLKWSPESSANIWINTDFRKKLRFNFSQRVGMAFDQSSNSYTTAFQVSYQPFNSFSLSVGSEYQRYKNKLQFVDNLWYGTLPRYLNAKLDQETLSMSVRFNYTINPNLTIQYWGQPFISKGEYNQFKRISNPTASEFNDRFVAYDDTQIDLINNQYEIDENRDSQVDYYVRNPNFSVVQFRSNLVVRWEYLPGSEVYVVWSQDVAQLGNPQDKLVHSLNDAVFGDATPQNIFLIKATYRFAL